LASRVDRHESLGKGALGWDVYKFLMSDIRFDGIPLILETPDDTLWPEEIRILKSMEE
jgi:deoxyribonuclease IV